MTSMPPLISVLIPAYNHERYVRSSVESVAAQDWPRMELIIIDDGSKDGTWAVLEQLKREMAESGKFERFEIFRQENQGTCVTLTRLINQARGEFVAMIASDDEYLPGAFSAMMEPMLKDDSVGLVVGQNELMDGEGRRCFWDKNREVVYDEEKAIYKTFNEFLQTRTGVKENSGDYGSYREIVKGNHIVNGFIVRKSFLDMIVPYCKEAPLEDWWFHMQLSKVARYKAVNAHTFRYRWHANNSIKQMKKMSIYAAKTLRYEYDRVLQSGNKELIDIIKGIAYSEKIIFSLLGILKILKITEIGKRTRVLILGPWRWTYHVKYIG